MTERRSKIFRFSQSFNGTLTLKFEQELHFPLKGSLDDCFHQIVAVHHIPPFAHTAVRNALEKFVEQENETDFEVSYASMLDGLRAGKRDLNRLCEQLDTAFRTHILTYASPARVTDEEVFGQAYNRVIHSPAAQQLMRLEYSFATAVATEVEKRNTVLHQLESDLMAETERGLQKRAADTPETITQLHASHVRHRELIATQWDSCLSELRRRQRRKLREFVMALDEQSLAPSDAALTSCTDPVNGPSCSDLISNSTNNLPSSIAVDPSDIPIQPPASNQTPKRFARTLPAPTRPSQSPHQPPRPWSDSITVQLGRQMRTTCNFRLLRADPNDLLQLISPATVDDDPKLSLENQLGERLSNALGIYSNELNGLVILVDKQLNSFRGAKLRLSEACERSTEFHFPDLSCQLTEIRQTIQRIAPQNTEHKDMIIRRPISNAQRGSNSNLVEPLPGDVFITRHSNLTGGIGGLAGGGGGISIVFHLVEDVSIEREEDRIRSGAPLHCALSAILRTCFDYDITTLSLPLLLVQSLQEYMDAAWRARRAETVFKALKGVLMELSTWRGPTVRSIQFIAPTQLSDAELASFSRIITASFLQPIPVIVPA